jgi:hypothetical protein
MVADAPTYVADQYLLGTPKRGIAFLDRMIKSGELGKPGPAAAYRRRLMRLLDRYGHR